MEHLHVSIPTWPTLSLRLRNVRRWVVVVYVWSHCSFKTQKERYCRSQTLMSCQMSYQKTHLCCVCMWHFLVSFCILEGENIVRHILNKLPLSLFSTRVKLTYFEQHVSKKLVPRYSKLRVGKKHRHFLSRLRHLVCKLKCGPQKPHLFFCFCFGLWTPYPGPGCGPLTPSTFLSEVY